MDSNEPAREQLEREIAALTASRDQFRDLVESTSDWVWEVDRDGKYTYVSARVRDMLGREPDDLIGTTPFDIMPPAEAERVAAIFQDIVSRAEPFKCLENVCLHTDGREVVVETSGVPVHGPDGDLKGYRGVDRDITDRKRVENLIHVQGRLAKTLNATRKLDEGLRLCLEASLSASGMDCGGIYLVEEASGALDIAHHQGLSDEFVASASHCDADSTNTRIVMAGEPVYTQHAKLGVPLDGEKEREGLLAIAVVPIRHEDRMIGCLNVASHRLDEVPTFSREVLETIAAEIGSAITRLQAEEALHQYARIVSSATDMLALVDQRYVYLAANAAYLQAFAKTSEDVIGRTMAEVFGEEFFSTVIRPRAERCMAGEDVRYQDWFDFPVSGRKYMDVAYSPYLGPDTEPRGFVVSGRDITERKRAAEALRKERNFAESLLDTAQVIVLVLDVEGRIVRFNPYMEEISGYSLAEVQGKNWFSTFLPASDHVKIKDLFKSAIADIQTRGNVNSIVTKDRSKRDIEWYDKTIKDDDGNVMGVLAVGLDITKRKQAEAERERLEEQLRQGQKMEAVGQLAGGIAHDLNNILTIIQGNAELLKMGLPSEGEQVEFADEVIKGAKRAADMTGQLLAFARKGKWRITPVDIHDIVTQTVGMLTHSIDRRIEIILELHASQSTVMGDPTQLQNVMLNLGVNARDAMDEGGVLTYATRNVTLAQADCDEHPFELTPGDFLEIRITDTGAGMDEQTQKRIFEPFFTTKDVGKGTGLGLAGVYGCIRNHDGSISVSSEPGRGAAFAILLPLTSTRTKATVQIVASDAPIRGTGHVLIVDDEESVRNFIRTSLKSMGYTVSVCDDGAAGVDYYREHYQEIDLVILDLIMPKMSGQDAFREMKKIDPNVKVLISSGFSHTQTTRQMLNEGAVGLLNKPFQITELAQAVARHIHHESPQ